MSFIFIFFCTGIFLISSFLIIDSDYLYYSWFLSDKTVEPIQDNTFVFDADGNISGIGSNGSIGSESSPYYGLNMMLMNKMAEGYCKDYLTIAEKHANGEAMQYQVDISDIDGNPLQVSVSTLVGTSISESGTWGGAGAGIPKSLINLESYGKSSGSLSANEMTFYSLNHNSYTKANSSDLYSGYWADAPDGPTVTTFQINRKYFALPQGQMTKPNGTYCSLPSKMNGYGYSSSDVRNSDQTDAAFLPDIFSYVIEQTLNEVADYPSGVFTSNGLAMLSSIKHGSGNGAISTKMVYGVSAADNPSVRLPDEQEKTVIANHINDLAAMILKGPERDNDLLFNMNFNSATVWRSYIAGVLISLGGFRAGDYCYDNNDGDWNAFDYLSGDASRRDALYLGLTGIWKPGVSKDEIYQEWCKFAPFDTAGKYAPGPRDKYGNEGYLYKSYSDTKVMGSYGTEVDSCTQINLITLAHMSSVISAQYYICQMMRYAGVDCDPNDVFTMNISQELENPNAVVGTPNAAVRSWFINAAKDIDKGAIADPEQYYGDVYDSMSGFAKLMLENWYWYTDVSNNKLQGCSYLWGGQCFTAPDSYNISQIKYNTPAGDNGNSFYHFKQSCIGRTKRYGFDCAGLVRTMTSDVLPNGILASGNSTNTTFKTYGSMDNIYGGYYNGNNPLGIGPLFKGGYTFSSKSNFSNIPVQLQPFDILGHNGHILFFICWIDKSAGRMLTLEATTGGELTGLHSTTIKGSLSGTVGLIQFDHENAYKYIMSNKRCIDPNSNTTEDSNHTTWNSAKNTLASDPNYMGNQKNGNFLNSGHLGGYAEGMQNLSF